MRLITIEFTEDTFREELDDSGEPVKVKVRSEGDRLHVDPRSAKSFCDVKKVAKRVGSTTDDDRSNDQVPAVVGEVDTPPSETGDQPSGETPSGETDAAGDQPGEQAATPRRGRGSSATGSSSS
jgi:hypothetical protein